MMKNLILALAIAPDPVTRTDTELVQKSTDETEAMKTVDQVTTINALYFWLRNHKII